VGISYRHRVSCALVAAVLCLVGAGGHRAEAQASQVTPLHLTFNALTYAQGGGDPSYQNIQITPSAAVPNASWSIVPNTTDGHNWLGFQPTKGSGNTQITVGAFPTSAGLGPGIYTGTLTVTIGAQTPIVVTVTLNLTGTYLVFRAPANNVNPASQNIAVSTASSTTAWSASISTDLAGAWLSATPLAGTGPGNISVSVNTSGLAQGTYTGMVLLQNATSPGTFIGLIVSAPVNSGPALSMLKSSGDLQTGIAGTALAAPLVVYVADGLAGNGNFALTTAVTFTVTSGSAVFSNNRNSIVVNSLYGLAMATPTLGTKPEIDTVTASAMTGDVISTQTFNFAVVAGPVSALDVVAATPAGVVTGTTLTPSVRAHDSYGNPIAGFTVNFQVTAGTGTLSSMTAMTDATGLASVNWTIGSGPNTLTTSGTGGFSKTFQSTGIVISTKPAVLPAQLTFSAVAGGPAPASQVISVITTPIPGSSFTVTLPTDMWLSVDIAKGVAPANVTVSVAAGLAAGTYTSSLTIVDGSNTVAVPVNVTVAASTPPKLAVSPGQLNFSAVAQSTKVLTQVVHLSNAGTGAVTFTSTVTAPASISWLSVSPSSGNAPADVTVTADASFQPAGLLSGLIAFTGSDGSTLNVQVQLNVSAAATLQIDTPALSFTVAPGATTLPSAPIRVLSASGSPTVTATIHQAQTWFAVTASATSTPTTLTVAVQNVPQQTGIYQAGLLVNSVEIPLTLIVSSATPCVSFTGGACASTGGTTTTFTASQTPTSTTPPASSTITVFQISSSPGLTYTYDATAHNANVSVDTTQAVNGGCLQLGAMQTGDPSVYTYQSCAVGNALAASNTSVLTVNQPLPSFTATAGVPIGIQAGLFDVSGNPVSGSEVRVRFSDGSPDLYLKDAGAGTYAAAWTPVNAGMIALTYTAVLAGAPAVVVSGTIAAAPASASFIPSGSAVNAASFAAAPLTAGSLASLFGVNLAASTAQSGKTPLPVTLGGISLSLNGTAVPLIFVSSAQINFQVPWELATVGLATMELSTGSAIAVLPDVMLAAASPGIFLAGGMQGAIVHQDGTLADATKPASQGETLLLYATALGPVAPMPATGSAAGIPLSNLVATPTVTIGGKTASVSFAGLAPTFVGLYQLNVTVPFGLASGVTPVGVQTGLTFSNSVTIVVK